MKPSSPTRPKPVGRFVVQALALTLLIGFWPTPRELYPASFHWRMNALFAEGSGRTVRMSGPETPAEPDTVMRGFAPSDPRPLWISRFSLTQMGWWPLAGLLALILATPLSARRRALALLAGVAALETVTLGRIGVEVAYAFRESELGPGGSAGGPLYLLLRVGSEALTASIPSAAAVLVVWVAVARPRAALDLSALGRLLGARGPAGPREVS